MNLIFFPPWKIYLFESLPILLYLFVFFLHHCLLMTDKCLPQLLVVWIFRIIIISRLLWLNFDGNRLAKFLKFFFNVKSWMEQRIVLQKASVSQPRLNIFSISARTDPVLLYTHKRLIFLIEVIRNQNWLIQILFWGFRLIFFIFMFTFMPNEPALQDFFVELGCCFPCLS
jgi:hypothetical protein